MIENLVTIILRYYPRERMFSFDQLIQQPQIARNPPHWVFFISGKTGSSMKISFYRNFLNCIVTCYIPKKNCIFYCHLPNHLVWGHDFNCVVKFPNKRHGKVIDVDTSFWYGKKCVFINKIFSKCFKNTGIKENTSLSASRWYIKEIFILRDSR